MRSIKLLAFISIAFLPGSCSESKNNKMINGHWAGAAWLINGQPSNRDIEHTAFKFDSTGHYSFVYADTKEEGTYKVENDMLFTTPAGQTEIMVKIKKLTNDSLVFDMNRGGQAEELTLIRK